MTDDPISAANLLRSARRRAGITQAELARRAGVQQSVISDYERGKRDPSLPTLARLVRATGLTLETRLGQPSAARRGMRGPLGRRIAARRRDLRRVARAHGVGDLAVFGSVARGEESSDSDVDILVDLPPGMGLVGLARLQRDLEDVLGVQVDLVPAGDLKPNVRDAVLSDVVTV